MGNCGTSAKTPFVLTPSGSCQSSRRPSFLLAPPRRRARDPLRVSGTLSSPSCNSCTSSTPRAPHRDIWEASADSPPCWP